MTALTGTRSLLGFDLRRGRVALPSYVVIFALIVLSTAIQSEELYATQAERDEYAATIADNAGMLALVGPAYAVTEVGGDVAWQMGGLGAVAAALMSMVPVGRHTRGDEQSGRSELMRSGSVGRAAPAVAALGVVAVAQALLAGAIALSLIGQGLAVEGSIALGLSLGAVGLVFGGVALVAAQASRTTSGMYGLVGAALGGSYVLRAAGDVGDGTLSWLSPIGWGQAVRPFAGERWWPLLLALSAFVVLAAVAFALLERRDDGGGILADRPGPPAASALLARPAGLALRVQRGALAGWTTGLLFSGLAIGSMAQDADSVLGEGQAVEDLLGRAGGTIVDQFLAVSLLSLAQIGAAFSIAAILKLRAEEREGRAEALLATALGRTRWAGGQIVVAMGGAVLVLGAGGLGMGIADAIVAGDIGRLPRLVGASLASVPAVWVLAGATVLLLGVAPRATPAAWGLLGASFLLAFLGPLLSLPDWVLGLSPFDHVPLVPAADFELGPLLALTAVAAALTAAGLAALRRRDLG